MPGIFGTVVVGMAYEGGFVVVVETGVADCHVIGGVCYVYETVVVIFSVVAV